MSLLIDKNIIMSFSKTKFVPVSIELFDLDGTLTQSGYSLWNLITRALVVNAQDFDAIALNWNNMIKEPTISNQQIFLRTLQQATVFKQYAAQLDDLAIMAMKGNKIQSSLAMTEIGIMLLCEAAKNPMTILQTAQKITHEFPEGVIIIDAIKYLRYRLEQGITCVISTASYEEGAKGFVAGLVKLGLISQELARKIKYSGTQVDWQTFKVKHMNADSNKLRGLEQVFSAELGTHITIEQLRLRIHAVFADDPLINDRAILQGLCKHSFVIRNENNAAINLPHECVFATWSDIYVNRDGIEQLYARLKRDAEGKNIENKFIQSKL